MIIVQNMPLIDMYWPHIPYTYCVILNEYNILIYFENKKKNHLVTIIPTVDTRFPNET